MDRQPAAVSEEFYDNLVTCDIQCVDCLITALVVEPTAIQRLKGELMLVLTLYPFTTVRRQSNQLSCGKWVTGMERMYPVPRDSKDTSVAAMLVYHNKRSE